MDRHTLFVMQGTLLLFLGGCVLLSHRAYGRSTADRSAYWFTAGYLLGGAGLLLQADRGLISPWLGIVLGNFLVFLLMPFMNRAVGLAVGVRTRYTMPAMLLLNVATVSLFAYQTFVRPNVWLRNAEAAAVMAIMTGLNASVLLRSRDEVIRPASRLIAVAMLFHMCSSVLRLVIVMRMRTEAWFSISGLLTITGSGIAFMWVDALRLRHQMEVTAMTDPLTGLFNRRALELLARRELQRVVRQQQPCSALMLDIDRFKKINDRLGHAAGDSSLCAVAGALAASLRSSDIATRLGGDEFFVLLPDADEDAAALVVARLRLAMDQLRLQTMGGEFFSVAVSIGQVTRRSPSMTVEDLLHGSDIVLYREKQLSRVRFQNDAKTHQPEAGGAHVHPSSA